MRLELSANLIGVDHEHAVVAGFAKQTSGEIEEQILTSRSLPEVESIPGVNGICIEKGEQQAITYGGITKATLSSGIFSVSLSPSAAKQLGGITELVIHFSPAHNQEIEQALSFIFHGCSCYVQRT